MKKLILFLLPFYLFASLPVKADEGMWTLYNLPQAVYEQMKAEGYELPYEKLYQADDAIMKSVVNFSGYCSGVVVSPDGLVFTNHHCGFEAIRSHSTVEHDYMLNGFCARNYAEELPNKDMFVSFMVEQRDVTDQVVTPAFLAMSSSDQEKYLDSLENAMSKEVKQKDKTLRLELKPSTRATATMPPLIAISPTCVWSSPSPSRWVSLAVKPTTGCGLARPATSPYSASMPTLIPTDPLLIPSATCPIIPSTGLRCRWMAIRKVRSR